MCFTAHPAAAVASTTGPTIIAILNTPCGTFVFWEANNPLDFGERLSTDKGHDLKCLIVDGQQRIRTLVAALEDCDVEFEPDESETRETSDIEEKGPKCWCINLTRLEELAETRASRFTASAMSIRAPASCVCATRGYLAKPLTGRPASSWRLSTRRMRQPVDHTISADVWREGSQSRIGSLIRESGSRPVRSLGQERQPTEGPPTSARSASCVPAHSVRTRSETWHPAWRRHRPG